MTKIPYKINLSEDELPKYWQNIRPYMQEAPDPFINPVTFKPCTADDLRPVFCDELIERSWIIPINLLKFRKKSVIFIKCIVHHH